MSRDSSPVPSNHIATVDTSNHKFLQPVSCGLSGVVLGTLQVQLVEGSIPFMQDFNRLQILHPFFAQTDYHLLKKFKESLDWFNDMEWYDRADQVTRLQVLTCCLLHRLDVLKQEVPGVPSWPVTAGSAARVYHLAKWYLMETSKRTPLPKYSVSRANDNVGWINLRFWLDDCYDIKSLWEKKTRQIERDEELKLRDAAVKSIKSQHYTRIDNRKVWNWIALQLAGVVGLKRLETFKSIFMSGDLEPELWLIDDVDDLIEAIVEHCDIGNEIMHYIRTRLSAISEHINDFNNSFTVVGRIIDAPATTKKEIEAEAAFFGSFDEAAKVITEVPPEPQQKDFATLGLFLKAQAQWRILKGRFDLLQQRNQLKGS
jgi:hypothetical protein